MTQRVLVAIPAWNEEATVSAVIREVLNESVADEVLVVDDGSTDKTGEVARNAGARVVTLPFNVGVGGAMRTAYLYALREGFDAVVQVDADGQHEAHQIKALLGELETHDVVIGSRFVEGGAGYRVRGPRRWSMWVLGKTLSRVAGTTLTDTTSGFRVGNRTAIELYAQRYPVEYLGDTVESIVIASRAGLSVGQISVTMRERQGGSPSQGHVLSSLYLGRAILALASALTRPASKAGR